ncbi:MAG: hypothetical protein HKN68_11775 [Saprospiraceae bacterium]|nr:hypothetical protein [Saprospiraceae bacterium]
MNRKVKHTLVISIWILLLTSLSIFEVDAQLSDLIAQANEQFSPIETDKEIINQEVVVDQEQPYNVELIRTTEKIKDGKQKVERYLFNIALLNENKVAIKSSKNKMLLKMETKGGKYIQRFEDEKSKGYTNVLEIQYVDIDDARSAKSTWEALIPVAKTDWTQAINLPKSLGDLKTWLRPYVGDVDMGKQVASQSLTESTIYDDYVNYEVSNLKGKEKREIYRFSLADIDNESLRVGPSGSTIKMDLKTEGNKKLILKEDEDGTTFQNNLTIYFADAGSALEMSKGMEVVTAMAQLTADERIKSYETCEDCLGGFSEVINQYQGRKINTGLEGDCKSVLTLDKGGNDESYEFRWADLDAKRVKQDFGTNEMKLTLETIGKRKFITKKAEGEIKGYQNKIEFYFNNLETFRKSGIQVKSIIESCDVDIMAESVTWMDELFSAGSINKMDQSISNEEECSVIYTSGDAEGDKSYSYEFNLYDLDSKRINMKISKSKLQLEVNTNNKEKIITKTNQDGKLEYTNKVILDFDNLDNLRKAELSFVQLIGGCSEG